MFWVGIILCTILFSAGMPIYIAFSIGGLIILLYCIGFPLSQMGTLFFDSLNSFILLSGPLFVLAGNLMVRSGVSGPLVKLLGGFVARVPGGLAVGSIVACTFMGSLTGTVSATLASVGLIMFPAMVAAGYSRGYSAGVLCSASPLGVLIPPSIVAIVFGYLTDASIGKLFIAGILPGLLMAGLLCLTAVFIAKRKAFPLGQLVGWSELYSLIIKALPALFLPVLILGGIYGGIFTPTEAAAVACVYTFVVGLFIKGRGMWEISRVSLTETVRVTSLIYLLLVGGALLGKGFILVGIPQRIASSVLDLQLGQFGFLSVLVIVVMALSIIMDDLTIMFVVVPLIIPTVKTLNINIIHLGVIFIITTMIGVISPPVATHLYFSASLLDVPIGELLWSVIPFLLTMVICLFIVVFFPEISVWLPGMMKGG